MSNTSDKIKSGANRIQIDVPRRPDGMVGVRATLRNMGIDNDLIGYNEANKTVTLGGRELMRPRYVDEGRGISYSMPSDIRQSVARFYSGTDNPVVRVSDAYGSYAGRYGLSADALGYSDGVVTIGGVPLDILYVDDEGKAWAFQNDVRALVDDYVNSLNVTSPNELLDRYNDMYLPQIESLRDSVANREEFSYDANPDPVYKAYEEQYRLNGERAAQDAMAEYSAMTGGYSNSSAVTAGALAQQYYGSRLSEMIPELAEAAYERYSESLDRDEELLEDMIDLYGDLWQNAYEANIGTVSGANDSLASNAARDEAAFERRWAEAQNRQNYDWTERQNAQESAWTDVLNGQKSRLNEQEIENAASENFMQGIYRAYYEDMLREELTGKQLSNSLTREQINRLILQNMLGL